MPVVNTGSMNVVQGTLGLTASNSGTVTVAAGAALSSDDYTQTAGSTILIGGEFDGGTFTLSGGILSGYGTVNANITNGEQVIPGGTGTAGVLTINGDYTQTPSRLPRASRSAARPPALSTTSSRSPGRRPSPARSASAC